MLVNLNEKLLDFDGKELIDTEKKQITLKKLCTNALLGSYSGDDSLKGEDKYKRFDLARKINRSTGDSIDLSVEQIALIKELLARMFGPYIVGVCYDVLEGRNDSTELAEKTN